MSSLKWLAIPALLTIATWCLFLGDRAPGTEAARVGLPLDDGWIHLVYSRSLVQEGGFHYNPGTPEAGMTSPLWVVVAASAVAVAGAANSGAIVLGVKLLSLASGLAAVGFLFLLAQELGAGAVAGAIACTLAALDPALTFARASGMEVELFSALVLGALVFALRGRALLASALVGLSLVTRPEGAVLVPVFAILIARGRRGGGRPSLRTALAAGGLAALPALAYAAFCLHATGRPLPNTFYAKFAPQNLFDPGLLAGAWDDYVHGDLPWFTLESGTVLLLLGLVRTGLRSGARGWAVAGAGALLFLSAVGSRRLGRGHYFYWERWIVPCFPFLLLLMAAGLDELRTGLETFLPRRADRPSKRRAAARPARPTGAVWKGLALAAALVLAAGLPRALRERADLYAWNAQNIQEMNVTLGRWVAAHTPPDAVVGASDAGAVRYFGGRTTIDLLGLNNHRALQHDPSLGPRPLEALHVRYLVVDPVAFGDLLSRLGATPLQVVHSPRYTICDAPQDVLGVYRLEPGAPGSR